MIRERRTGCNNDLKPNFRVFLTGVFRPRRRRQKQPSESVNSLFLYSVCAYLN